MIVIRPFDPAADDYAVIVAIYNANWPGERQYTAELWRDEDAEWPTEWLHRRFVAELDGRIIGIGGCYEKFWAHQPGTVHVDFHLDPALSGYPAGPEASTRLFEFIVDYLRRRSPPARVIASETREDRPERIAFLSQRGFQLAQRTPRASLDVAHFDPSPHETLFHKLADQGVVINSLAHHQARDPSWKTRLYDLRWAIMQDVPSVEPPRKPTLDEFEHMILDDPALDGAAWFIAVDESQASGNDALSYIGMSNLWLNDSERKRLDTGLTGVVRRYRRRGIATALKVRTIEFAQQVGASTIETGNEEANPMFALNVKLGFQPKPAWLSYRWQLA